MLLSYCWRLTSNKDNGIHTSLSTAVRKFETRMGNDNKNSLPKFCSSHKASAQRSNVEETLGVHHITLFEQTKTITALPCISKIPRGPNCWFPNKFLVKPTVARFCIAFTWMSPILFKTQQLIVLHLTI